MDTLSQKHYIYTLAYPDGTIFYVGKGAKSRDTQNLNQARSGYVSPKCETIRKIWEAGEEVIVNRVAFFDNEEEAYLAEEELINSIGLKNLTNRTGGGGGGYNRGKGKTKGKPVPIYVDLTIPGDLAQALRERGISQHGERQRLILRLLKEWTENGNPL